MKATKCRCLYACPDGQINGTCFLKEGGYCFTNVRTFDNSNGRIDQEVVYGCFPPDVEGLLQCKGNLSPHLQPQKVICCQNGDYCNSNAPVPIFNETFIEQLNREIEVDYSIEYLITCITIILIVISMIVIAVYYFYRRGKVNENCYNNKCESEDSIEKLTIPYCKEFQPFPQFDSKYCDYQNISSPRPLKSYGNTTSNSSSYGNGSSHGYKYAFLNSNSSSHIASNFNIHNNYRNSSATSNTTSSFASENTQQTTLSSQKVSNTLPTLLENTSGSSSGQPYLVQETLARQIHLKKCIGKGRYGNVWLGERKSENVAVKIFFSRDEASWLREIEIYSTVIMRHDSILGFLGADIISQNCCTELWLVTEYIELGSMFDYLTQNTLTSVDQMLSLMSSIIDGVYNLHTEIIGTCGKPAIAHRDIKSKNILMRSNTMCCIADFGLAVTKTQTNKINIADNHRVGTKRYMAPEVLTGNYDSDIFKYYRLADIYALGLVFWELFNRLQIGDAVNDYHVPYYNLVSSDPSIEEMRQVVCERRQRPQFNQPFLINNDSNMELNSIKNMISECWSHNPDARLTSLRIKKIITQMIDKQ